MLILLLIITLSLLVGVSLQHFQLLRKFLDTKAELEKSENTFKFQPTMTVMHPETTTASSAKTVAVSPTAISTNGIVRTRLDTADMDENTIPK